MFPGPVILNVKVNGMDLPKATRKLPHQALKNTSIRIDFEVDTCVPRGALHQRELALLVVFRKPGLEGADALHPFQLT
jgi:hypothetical protein